MARKTRAKASAKHRTAVTPSVKVAIAPKPKPSELLTLLDFVRYAVSRFAAAKLTFAHGTTDPVAEAAFIVCEMLHLHPEQFETFATARVTAAEGKRILDVIDRRVATRKPAAYLVNRIYMRGLPFHVDERVIVPRSFIGELLDSHFGGEDGSLIDDPSEISSVLDLCTGSGCLAIALAYELPHAEIIATDISSAALRIARRNALRNTIPPHNIADRIRFIETDLLPAGNQEPAFDLIVSNPPYIADSEAASLQREVRDHEPREALFAGPTGAEIYTRLVAAALRQLRNRGILVLELGHNSADEVRALFDAASSSWTNLSITMDLAGIPRVLAAERLR